jgi:hypothetical protein
MEIEIFTVMLMSLLALVLLYSMAAVVIMILDGSPKFHELFEYWHQKELIRHNVYQHRLSSMLRYLGIGMDNYITKLSEREIRHHIMRCKNCPNLSACDRFFHEGEMSGDLNFCPNYSSLLGISRTIS